MVKNHIKRLTMPLSWKVKRKSAVFISKPNPGAHSQKSGISLVVVMRDLLKFAKTAKEVKSILNNKNVTVNGKKVREIKFNIGLMDVLSFEDIKESYRMVFDNKGNLTPIRIDEKEKELLLLKVISKRKIKGKTQLNLGEGRNILVDKDEYKTGDSVLLNIKDNKISKKYEFKEGNLALLLSKKFKGKIVKIEKISEWRIFFKEDDKEQESKKEFAMIVGDSNPAVTLENE